MSLILSIQSHVTYGYVGNRVATFALQRLKHDVISINTVQFSNHTGYGEWEGEVFSIEHLKSLWSGIKQRVDIKDISALLTGYLGHESLGAFIQEIKHELQHTNPELVYCLDPVFGDVGRDLFVRPELANFYRDKFIGEGSLITPNHFEMNYLSQTENQTIAQLKQSAAVLFHKGVQTILVTSYLGEECHEDEIGMVLLTASDAWLIKTPKIDFVTPPNGSGDLVAAILLDKVIKAETNKNLLEQLATQIYTVFDETKKSGQRELQLIAAQDVLVDSSSAFTAVKV